MRRGTVVWIAMILAVMIGIALIDAGVTRPIDWRKTFNIRDKVPFGLFVLHQEFPQILGSDRQYSDFGDTFYEEIEALDSAKRQNAALVLVTDYADLYPEDVEKIVKYAENGGEIFLSALYFSEELMDTLGIYSEQLDYTRFLPNDNRVTYSLGQDTTRIQLDKFNTYYIFSKLNAKTCTVLGHIHSRGRALPNFIKVSLGKGSIFLHHVPDVFTNYHMLQTTRYAYATHVLNFISKKEVLLADEYMEAEQPHTPLRVILSQPGFYQAWYLLLIGLVLLLVFKSKREQRAVKVINPEPNLSKEFAQTIGNLYYENGQPGNIILKKIDYFLFAIRSTFHLETLDILDDKFIRQLASKAGVDQQETQDLMQLLDRYRQMKNHRTEDVKKINSSIEDFKQKANIS